MKFDPKKEAEYSPPFLPHYERVFLTPWQVEWGVLAGMERYRRNKDCDVQDTDDYKEKENKQPEDIANVSTCLCELATSLRLNKRWNGPFWSPKYHKPASSAPDVGYNIEVRRTRYLPNSVPIKEDEKDSGRRIHVVQAYVPFNDVVVGLEQFRSGKDQFSEMTVWLTGTILAAEGWKNSFAHSSYSTKLACPAWLLQPVCTLLPNDPVFKGATPVLVST